MNNNSKSTEERIQQLEEDVRDIRNDVAQIKSDTRNINRISTLTNTTAILSDIKDIIGNSEIKAAVLHLTKEEISAQDLATQIRQDPRNLNKFIGPFTGKKAYIIDRKVGRNKFFVRAEIVDLINIEEDEDFARLLASWRARTDVGLPTLREPVPPAEQAQESD
jgi:hypothetical protein